MDTGVLQKPVDVVEQTAEEKSRCSGGLGIVEIAADVEVARPQEGYESSSVPFLQPILGFLPSHEARASLSDGLSSLLEDRSVPCWRGNVFRVTRQIDPPSLHEGEFLDCGKTFERDVDAHRLALREKNMVQKNIALFKEERPLSVRRARL